MKVTPSEREAKIHGYKWLVGRIVSQKVSAQHPEREDLLQVGLVGLIKAIDNHNASMSVNLEGYARTCIKNAIFDYWASDGNAIACRLREIVWPWYTRAIALYGRDTQSPVVLAKFLNCSVRAVEDVQYLLWTGEIVSLDCEVEYEGESMRLSETITEEHRLIATHTDWLSPEEKAELEKAIKGLSVQLFQVVILFFYYGLTMREIASLNSMTLKAVDHRVKKAVRLLRRRFGISEKMPIDLNQRRRHLNEKNYHRTPPTYYDLSVNEFINAVKNLTPSPIHHLAPPS